MMVIMMEMKVIMMMVIVMMMKGRRDDLASLIVPGLLTASLRGPLVGWPRQ